MELYIYTWKYHVFQTANELHICNLSLMNDVEDSSGLWAAPNTVLTDAGRPRATEKVRSIQNVDLYVAIEIYTKCHHEVEGAASSVS